MEVAYQRAWTAFWWFEDVRGLSELYAVTELRARETTNVYDLERLVSLWHLVEGSVGRGLLDASESDHPARTARVLEELARLAADVDRPSTSLQARALGLQVQLAQRLRAEQDFDDELQSLREIVESSSGLVGFPLEPLADILTEMSPLLESSEEYDSLFDTIVEVVSSRKGAIRGARLLLRRGERQLLQGKPYDCVLALSRCLGALYKEESRHDFVRALYLCGCALDALGLPWAARGALLSAASVATNDWWRLGEMTPHQATCYARLKRIELSLGRIAQALAWHEVDQIVRYELAQRGYASDALYEADVQFDTILGSLILRADPFDLRAARRFPDLLDRMGLDMAATALLYALGHEPRLAEAASSIGSSETEFVQRWSEVAARSGIAHSPQLGDPRTTTLVSRVLGLTLEVETDNQSPAREVAESLLAAIEAFLATSVPGRAFAHEPRVRIRIRNSDFADAPFAIEVGYPDGVPLVTVSCRGFDPHRMSVEEQKGLRGKMFELVARVAEQAVAFTNPAQALEELFRDELIHDRAINFSASFSTTANVLGNPPPTRLSDLVDDEDEEYPITRRMPLRFEQPEISTAEPTFAPRGAEPPAELTDPNLTRHSDMIAISPIRTRLWDQARWDGTGFGGDPEGRHPPILAFIFRNAEPGQEIFRLWRTELGSVDQEETLRISVVRGIDASRPAAYAVVISANPRVSAVTLVTIVSRISRMDPTDSTNLDNFLAAYRQHRCFILAPAYAAPGAVNQVEMDPTPGILIRALHVREAWEVGRHDPDAVAISLEHSPVIPPDIDNPPIAELLEWKARRDKL